MDGAVVLKLDSNLNLLGEEGCSLRADSHGITISAYQPAGIFYGIQTLRQLLPVAVFPGHRGKPLIFGGDFDHTFQGMG